MKNSQEIIADAIREYWKECGYSQPVVAFFSQRHSTDDEWERMAELARCRNCYSDTVEFDMDFCEGQTMVKDVVVVALSDVVEFYMENCLMGS